MSENITYTGGYFLLKQPLVRGTGPNRNTANDLTKVGVYPIAALNLIQETPWAVNGFVLEVVNGAAALGANLSLPHTFGEMPEVILRLMEPVHPKDNPFDERMQAIPKSIWDGMAKEAKKPIITRRRKAMEQFEEQLGEFRSTVRIINAAREMVQFEKFYFPHNMDFRGRNYPIPTDLTPQGNDLAKGLLRFTRGHRLGQRGLYWLAVSVATHWGQDKLAMDERVAYVKGDAFPAKLIDWVDDPLNNRGWLEADAPFQFLAAAHEWVWANRLMEPETFLSHLPVHLDGSCNGAQHLSIITRDLVGATATNCRSSNTRHDLYMEVGDRVWEDVQTDAAGGNELALEWYPKMEKASSRRKIVKRSVMTVPYGVTEYGIADFMIKDGHVEGNEKEWDSAKYMRDLIWKNIGNVLQKGQKLQQYISVIARLVAEKGLPLCWDTPAGMKITQAYRNLIEKRIQTLNTRFLIYTEPEEGEDIESLLNRVGMDAKKMGTGAPPNVIHSCDAAHLQITVTRMGEAGIRDFSMVHDSFGCPAAYVDLMRDILRKSIVDMYSGNYLLTWKESVEHYSGLTLPEPPFELGEFDITEILSSEFFFS